MSQNSDVSGAYTPPSGGPQNAAAPSQESPLGRLLWGAVSAVSAVGVFLMMVVAFVDVFGRKFLDQPLRGSVELTELMMLLVVFLGIAMVSRERNHVQLDLIDEMVPPRLQDLRTRVGELLSAILMAGAAWLATTRAIRAAQEGEMTTLLLLPLAPAYYAVAALMLIAALAHITHVFSRNNSTDKESA